MTEIKHDSKKHKEQIDCKKDSIVNDNDDITGSSLTCSETTSLSTLIVWNITKALEKNPKLDIKEAITVAQRRLELVADAKDAILSEHSHERHLACALLAWQQLGHKNADSLCRFVENNRNEENASKLLTIVSTTKEAKLNGGGVSQESESISRTSKDFFARATDSSSHYSCAMGPVVKLPVETKVVMRMENTSCAHPQANKPKAQEQNILKKIEECCLDSGCLKQLSLMDTTTEELMSRAGMLAHREAERVELLERAEAAWRDLETGYQRRLTLAEEKEEDIVKQIAKLVDERTSYKEACTTLAQKLKETSEEAEKKRTSLNELEKKLCECACQRLKICEESAIMDSLVTEHSCRIAQMERDLLFKEEEEQRKVQSLRDEVESAQALSLESERALRAELCALRDQIADVSTQLLEEDSKNKTIKTALEFLREEKMELVENLDGCKTLCDGRMQGIIQELNEKREQLDTLKIRVIECRCKMPVDVAVEVKRTPSFAASCKCTPEDKILKSCSCTSMRTKLLSNLLADLFGGLRFELDGWVTLMPCHLLKCLEDKHNWDSSSSVKTSLKNYFSGVLAKELDIAITTSVEDYHIRWVGPSCADKIKPTDPENENWQERAIECRAQKLATQLAEQLFQERTEDIKKRSRLPQKTQPPCDCSPDKENKLCPCDQKPSIAVYWHQTMQDVTQLRQQVEDLKKDYLKKDDLKTMENKFAQIIQLSPACCSSERDKSEEKRQGSMKKSYGRVASVGGNVKVGDGKVRNVAVNETAVFPCLVNNSQGANEVPVPATATYWHRAIQDFTRLRLQIEDLKKESINKEDLRMMGDKIAEIVHRASGATAPSSAKMDYYTSGNVATEVIKKEQKIHKAQNISGSHNFDFNNKLKKGYKTKSVLKNGVDKPFKPNKKNDHTYAVNLCLCAEKTHQPHNPNEKCKLGTTVWKQKVLKDAVSQMSSSIRQAKPINDSFFSQDISARTYSKESEDKLCPSNCVCFHKIPSNTSIDILLETLAKWKGDLDEPVDLCIEKLTHGNPNVGCRLSQDENTCFKSRISDKSKAKSKEKSSLEKLDDSRDEAIKHKICLELSNESKKSKYSEKVHTKSTGLIGTTDSEYMGTVNLDKSNEEICKCNIEAKLDKKMPFKCITSNKCCCDKTLQAKKLTDQNMVCIKKENQQEVSSIRKKQDRHMVKNPLKSKLSKKILQSQEKQPVNSLDTANENARILGNSDYQIKFLGVTLADANPPTRTQVNIKSNDDKCSNKNILTNNFLLHKESEINISTTSTKNQVYTIKNSTPIPEFSDLSNSINKSSKNILTDKDKKEEITKKEIFKTYSEDKDNNKKNEHYTDELKVPLVYTEKPYIIPLENSKKYFDKISTDQEIPKITTAVNNSVSKMYDQDENIYENNIIKHSTLTNENMTETSGKQMISCECDVKLNELKSFLKVNFSKRIVSEDIALDVQSLKNFKNTEDSCICCNKLSTGESKDLEDNTFHLLEEFLKKKLDEFKALSCSYSFISQEQEEKMFTIILQRVKQLILDSTNHITCKCSIEEQKSQGSWKRAYGLLQEYIKMKIKKVQCSCFLAENNNDELAANNRILPEVLEKICNLIENDFKRLKDIYRCISDPNSQENAKKKLKQVNFESGGICVPNNEDAVLLASKDKVYEFPQTTHDQVYNGPKKGKKTMNVKKCMTSQIPITLSMEINSCKHMEALTNNMKVKASTHSCKKYQDYDQYNDNIELLSTNFNYPDIAIEEFFIKNKDLSSVGSEIFRQEKNGTAVVEINESELQNNENVDFIIGSQKKNSSLLYVDITTEPICKEASNCSICTKSADITSTTMMKSIKNNSKSEQVNLPCIHKTKNQDIINKTSMNNDITQNSQQSDVKKSLKIPYIGYTINCSCDNSFGVCICPKPISKAETDVINNIWKNAIPDETYFKKISYITHSQPKENINQNAGLLETSYYAHLQGVSKNNVVTDNYLKECETTCSKNEELVLIKSIENNNIKQTHATTNTLEDNTSLDIVYSFNEDILDSCESSSHCNSNNQSDSERLKNSLHFPVPIANFEDENLKPQMSIGLRKHACDCEKVPICHVKMLVENIEAKLANADCTCDSLISKVCPVHASMS